MQTAPDFYRYYAPDYAGAREKFVAGATAAGAALSRYTHRGAAGPAGETLSVVLGDPSYYGRFGYARDRALQFDSDYQGDALQAIAWGDAPTTGRLVYPKAFGSL